MSCVLTALSMPSHMFRSHAGASTPVMTAPRSRLGLGAMLKMLTGSMLRYSTCRHLKACFSIPSSACSSRQHGRQSRILDACILSVLASPSAYLGMSMAEWRMLLVRTLPLVVHSVLLAAGCPTRLASREYAWPSIRRARPHSSARTLRCAVRCPASRTVSHLVALTSRSAL